MEKKGLIIVFNKWVKGKDWDRSKYFNFLKKKCICLNKKSGFVKKLV